jgi:hypothetical protein
LILDGLLHIFPLGFWGIKIHPDLPLQRKKNQKVIKCNGHLYGAMYL